MDNLTPVATLWMGRIAVAARFCVVDPRFRSILDAVHTPNAGAPGVDAHAVGQGAVRGQLMLTAPFHIVRNPGKHGRHQSQCPTLICFDRA